MSPGFPSLAVAEPSSGWKSAKNAAALMGSGVWQAEHCDAEEAFGVWQLGHSLLFGAINGLEARDPRVYFASDRPAVSGHFTSHRESARTNHNRGAAQDRPGRYSASVRKRPFGNFRLLQYSRKVFNQFMSVLVFVAVQDCLRAPGFHDLVFFQNHDSMTE